MNKQQWMTLAYWTMILFVIATCIFVYFFLQSNGNQCLADPLTYYSDKIGVNCFCMDIKPYTP